MDSSDLGVARNEPNDDAQNLRLWRQHSRMLGTSNAADSSFPTSEALHMNHDPYIRKGEFVEDCTHWRGEGQITEMKYGDSLEFCGRSL
jgi:hypothetical protein